MFLIQIPINQPVQSIESAVRIRAMLDTTNETLNALRVLEINVDHWDPKLLLILTHKQVK